MSRKATAAKTSLGIAAGICVCVLAGYRSLIVLPNAHRQPLPQQSSTASPTGPRLLTATDAVKLNARFSAAGTPATIAPSDVDIINQRLLAQWSVRNNSTAFVLDVVDTQFLNVSFMSSSSGSTLTPESTQIINKYYADEVALTTKKSQSDESNPLLERLLSPVARILDAAANLIVGFFEQISTHPQRLLLPAIVSIFYYVVTLAGICASAIYGNLDVIEHARVLDVKYVLRRAFTAAGWQGLMVSPLIFGLAWGAVETHHVTASMSLLAFQNGFFWRSALQTLAEQRGARTDPKNKPKKVNRKPTAK